MKLKEDRLLDIVLLSIFLIVVLLLIINEFKNLNINNSKIIGQPQTYIIEDKCSESKSLITTKTHNNLDSIHNLYICDGSVKIETNNEDIASKICSLLIASNDTDEVDIIEYHDNIKCLGHTTLGTRRIVIYNCNKEVYIRGGFSISEDNWLKYVLYHEIGHLKFWTIDENTANNYAKRYVDVID